MRPLVAAFATLTVALTAGCGRDGSNPLAPSPSMAAPANTAGTPSAHAFVPDLGGCFRQAGPECFTAGISAGVPSIQIHDIGVCLQASPIPGCVTDTRARTLAIQAAAATVSTLTYTSTGSSVTLTWTPIPAGNVILSYVIEAGSASGLADLANFSTGSTSTSFSASGIGPGTYFVRVRALTSSGPTAPSNEVAVVVGAGPCSTPPGPSTLSITSIQGGTVTLAWTAAGGAASYVLEAGTSSGLANLVNADQGSATTLTATGVGAGTYFVRIRGRNACGVGAASNEVVVVVGAPDVEYRVTGTVSQALITYVNSSGQTVQGLAPLPWSYSWSAARAGQFLFVSAQQQGGSGSVVVSTYKNGVLYRTSTAEGANAIALTSGTY